MWMNGDWDKLADPKVEITFVEAAKRGMKKPEETRVVKFRDDYRHYTIAVPEDPAFGKTWVSIKASDYKRNDKNYSYSFRVQGLAVSENAVSDLTDSTFFSADPGLHRILADAQKEAKAKLPNEGLGCWASFGYELDVWEYELVTPPELEKGQRLLTITQGNPFCTAKKVTYYIGEEKK
jgi:hypothetical protein